MAAFISYAALSVLLLSATSSAVVQHGRHTNLRHRETSTAIVGVGRQPTQAESGEQEVLTREDVLQQGVPQDVQTAPQPQPVQSLAQQQQSAASVEAQRRLQEQALQMQQMQQQLRQQQQELHRLQVLEKQRQQQPQTQERHMPAPASSVQQQPPVVKVTPLQAPKNALMGVSTKVMTQSELQSGTSGVERPKGWDQCLKFARFVKTQDVTGLELVRVWQSTCKPAVLSGRATERYKLMCNSLSGVIQPYSAQIDYDVEQLCDSVLAVFHDVTATDAKAR